MQRLVEYADELVTSIGPRPSASDAEHGAADLIAANLEDMGLDTWIQDFTCARNTRWVRVLYCMLGVIAAELLFIMPGMAPLALVLALVVFALLALELIDKNPLTRLFSGAQSQNVVARYLPEGADPRRKVVVIAHYDSGRSMLQCAPPVAPFYLILRLIVRVCIAALVVVALLSLFPLPELVLSVLSILGLIIGIVLLVAALVEVVNLFMPPTQGANCNASGVAAMMGVAETLVGGRSDAGLDRGGRSHEAADAPQGRTARQSSVGGVASSLFSRAKGALGKKGSDARDTLHHEGHEDDFMEVSASQRLRSGEPQKRGARQSNRATPSTGTTERHPAEHSAAADMGTADLGPGVSRAASGRSVGARRERSVAQIGEELGMPAERVAAEKMAAERPAPQLRVGTPMGNPAIRTRPPLAEQQEEHNRAAEQEAHVREASASDKTKDGMPSWFVDAKKAAKKDSGKAASETEPKVARSRFADVPVEYKPENAAKTKPAAAPQQEPQKATAHEAAKKQDERVRPLAGLEPYAADSNKLRERPLTERAAAAPEPQQQQKQERQRPQEQASAPEPPTTLNADFTGIDRLASDPLPTPAKRTRLPESASPLEQAVAAPTPSIPENERLRDLPSLSLGNSGAIPRQQAAFDQQTLFEAGEQAERGGKVSNTGSFAPLGATGIMKPVGEELLEYHDGDEQDIYLDDADESGTGSFSTSAHSDEYSPHMVEIPQSRTKSFFGSLGDRLSGGRNKNENLDSSPASWLGVDEDYDARTEGSQIGGWENFSEEDDDNWKGGAYGGESYEEDAEALARFSSVLIDKEVWFVALGAHESNNAGIKALLANHERELKSALFINLDGVGAGDLCYTMAEGTFRPRGTDHRLQGLIRSAADALGLDFAPAGLRGYNSDASAVMRSGARAISIVGLEGQMPAGWHWKDDRLDILDEDNLDAVADVVVEVIKSV